MKRLLTISLCVLSGFVFACVLFVASVSLRPAGAGAGVSNGDVNGDGSLDVSDAVYLLVHLFKGGTPPAACADTPDLIARVAALEDTNNRIADALEELVHPCRKRADRFVDNGDGTVTDTCTGLMWQDRVADRNGDGFIEQNDWVMWQQAVDYCEGLELGGHADWRLPSANELEAIIKVGTYTAGGSNTWIPPSDPAFGLPMGGYWTADDYKLDPTSAWVVNFSHNQPHGSNTKTSRQSFVLAVRGP